MAGSPDQLLPILHESWSSETSSQWPSENPARGQCNVTTLVVQDLFGGEILKTAVSGGWHFYNRIDGERHDLTAGQFAAPIPYSDLASSREEALAGTGEEQYAALKARVRNLQTTRDRC